VKTPLRITDGLVTLPQAPGLGVEVDEVAVAKLTVKGS
jgi:L-alanine-DL-glutamate epimerase-like enolase superfamily enzyme